jgi:hypothetical protein
MNSRRKNKLESLLTLSHGPDPDKAIQQSIFDILVEEGLSVELSAIVVSNVGRMDLRDMWKRIKEYTKSKRADIEQGSEFEEETVDLESERMLGADWFGE